MKNSLDLPTRRKFLSRLGVASMATLLPSFAHAAGTIRIGGTGSGLGLMRVMGERFRREVDATTLIDVLPSLGSGGGLKALAAGAIDIAIISRPLTAAEQSANIRAVPFGRTPLVFGVSQGSTKKSYTLEQIAALYAEPEAVWPDGRKVRLVLRPDSDIDTAFLKQMSPSMSRAVDSASQRKGMYVATTDQDAADAIESVPGSIGLTSLAIVRSEGRKIDVLQLNGVTPGTDALASGKYEYAKRFLLVYRLDRAEKVESLLAFLATPKAKADTANLGWLPE